MKAQSLSLCSDIVHGHFALLSADLSIFNLGLTNKHYVFFYKCIILREKEICIGNNKRITSFSVLNYKLGLTITFI